MDAPREPPCEDAEGKAGAELRRLRTERGLSLTALSRQVHYSKGYLSKIETGDKRITPEVARCADEALDTGGVLTTLLSATPFLEGAADKPEPAVTDVCPYPGLAAFGPAEARWFFGREQVTADLVAQLDERLANGGPLAVVAPSGAGKSSLLSAGLIPALARGALPGSHTWKVVRTTPGAHPLADLAIRVAAVGGAGPAEVAAVERNPQAFPAMCATAATGGKPWETPCSARMVLIVDQFEETFTECREETERRAFITALCAAAQNPVVVVLGMRADFYGRCLAYPALLTAVNEGHLALGPMSPAQIREVITGPAAAECLDLEPGLVELLLGELGAVEGSGPGVAGHEVGALPLLAHALRMTWQQRASQRLTVAGYRRTGGIRGAIAATAERAYTRLNPTEQQVAQQALLRLVQVGEQTSDTRRRLARARLVEALPVSAEVTETVLEVFVQARLITFDADSVEITHEALLRAWPRLADWISADRAGLCIHQQLTEAVEVWEADGRDPFLLYRGSRLAIAQEWASGPGRRAQLSASEEAYLDASIGQEQREAQTERRRTSRLYTLVGALAVLLVLALLAGSVAFQQRHAALSQRRLAIVNELETISRTLASKQPDASMLLAVEAFHLQPTPETRGALLSAQSQYFVGRLTGHIGDIETVAFSRPDGRLLATASYDGTVRLWDVASHQSLATLTGHTGPVFDGEFSPDGRLLATAGEDGTVRLWDVASHQSLATLTGHTGVVYVAKFSPDGRILATGGTDNTAQLWDLASNTRIVTLTGHTGPVNSVAFSPDGHLLVTGGDDGTARLWDVVSHRQVGILDDHNSSITWVAFSPDGHTVATGSKDQTVRLWNTSGPILMPYPPAVNNDVVFSPNGRLLATVAVDGTTKLVDVASRRQIATLVGHIGPVYAATFSPDGRLLATASEDGTVRLWDVPSHQSVATLDGHAGAVHSVAFSPDGRILATGGSDASTTLWDMADRRQIAILPGRTGTGAIYGVAFSPDGHTLATAGTDGTGLWDVASRHEFATTLADPTGGTVNQAVFSPEGHILATVSDDGTTRLRDVSSHQLLATLTDHVGAVKSVAFSPDGRVLATGSDSTVQLWDAASHYLIATLTGHTDNVYRVAFSPDGHTLATASGDSTIRLWDIDVDRVTARLCRIVGTPSRANWAQLIPDLPYQPTCR